MRDGFRVRQVRDEHGQTMVFSVLMIATLFAFAAVVVDSGLWFHTKRNLQGDADAAALAGGMEMLKGTGPATVTARDYAEAKNAADGASFQGAEFSQANTRMKVTVSKVQPGPFMEFFSFLTGDAKSAPTIKARSTVELAQYAGGPGMLPIGVMKDAYDIGDNLEAKFDDPGNGNRGLLEPDHLEATQCVDSNPQDIYDMISHDGSSCAYPVKEPPVAIPTATGNKTGPTLAAFNERIPTSDKDSFEDIFEYDAGIGRYIVKKPDSPRIGIVPIIQNTDGSTNWPNGSKDVQVVGYVMVYIGNRDDAPSYRPTKDGKSTYFTPVDAVLPESWGKDFTTNPYNSARPDGPLVVRLVE